MNQEKFNLTWHSYTSHLQKIVTNLLKDGESSDVTLFCDDQVKFQVHKFILKACSSVFGNILDGKNEPNSMIYLRGVNPMDLKSVLEFIYYGQASFYQERMESFLTLAQDLGIEELRDLSRGADLNQGATKTEDKETDYEVNFNLSELNSKKEDNIIEKQNYYIPIERNSTKCPNCDKVFAERNSIKRHIDSVHAGVKHKCNQCSFEATLQQSLKRHIKSVHEGFRYQCSYCSLSTVQPHDLKRHIREKHSEYTQQPLRCKF